MADFPATIYDPRALENLEGIDYVPADVKTIFAEDINKTNDEVVAIEQTLGENPQGMYATVRAWLDALEAGGGGVSAFGNPYITTFDITVYTYALYFVLDLLEVGSGFVFSLDTGAVVVFLDL